MTEGEKLRERVKAEGVKQVIPWFRTTVDRRDELEAEMRELEAGPRRRLFVLHVEDPLEEIAVHFPLEGAVKGRPANLRVHRE